jgi:U4/U6.U5 tri-snRNP-associated protein 1
MPSEDVIELSVEETNKLRAELGLKPLRIGTKSTVAEAGVETSREGSKNEDEEALELSVEETNKLREKLGLAPLRDSSSSGNKEIHKPAENTGLQEEASQRIQQAKLRRQVEEGAAQVFGSSTLALDDENEIKKNDGDGVENKASSSWAERMRQQVKAPPSNNKKNIKQQQQHNKSRKGDGDYNEAHLEGMQVRNSMVGLEAGENAVLTLADTSILETKTSVSNKVVGINNEEDALENIQLAENERQQDGLRKKRMLEMGMGRAGGYAGFDDDEFEELGGTLGPSSQGRGMSKEGIKTSRGFRIGSQTKASEDDSQTDFDKVMKGKAISLVWKEDVVSGDYMTIEEELEEKRKKKSKKETKFKKKKKSKKKRRRADIYDDEDEERANNATIAAEGTKSDANLLSKLESTADSNQSSSLQKRRRIDDAADDEESHSLSYASSLNAEKNKSQQPQTKRTNYDKIMEKGNERTNKAFNTDMVVVKREDTTAMDEELDDSFLNAALAKARRLNRLREMNKSDKVSPTGADAVAEAVKSTSVKSENSKQSSGISFSIDDTREFSRAIRARTQQKERKSNNQTKENSAHAIMPTKDEEKTIPQTTGEVADKLIKQEGAEGDVEMEVEEEDIEELAKQVKEDSVQYGYDGSTADSAGVGRGLSSFVSMLKTTGEITGKHGGKEELRGRAKDERNYDNYEPLDLSKVVSIGKNATSKDQELANREIKLEYRDKHGRLLTQKEAYRDLCYQFHGHGASKRKEEKRLKQITREQAEARMASGQLSAARDGTAAGTLGALKATQKATGKAFIVHKT